LGHDFRDLYKAFGLLFVITVEAKGWKFGVVPLVLNVASGLALLGGVSYVLPKRIVPSGSEISFSHFHSVMLPNPGNFQTNGFFYMHFR